MQVVDVQVTYVAEVVERFSMSEVSLYSSCFLKSEEGSYLSFIEPSEEGSYLRLIDFCIIQL